MFYTNVCIIGNKICVRGYQGNTRFKEKKDFDPIFFVPSKKESEWKSLDGQMINSIHPGNLKESRDFLQGYKKMGNVPLYGNNNLVAQYIQRTFGNQQVDHDKIRTYTIDIEVWSGSGFPRAMEASQEVLSIALHDSTSDRFYVWGTKPYNPKPGVSYKQCESERDLLYDFHKFWCENTPDIVTGWHSNGFDLLYIMNRWERVYGEQARWLSPWSSVRIKEIRGIMPSHEPVIQGVATLDYKDLYQKYTYSSQESYKLDHIAFVELGERKLSYDEYSSLHELYQNDHQKFIDYNIRDVELVVRLNKKMHLIGLHCTLAYKAGINYQEAFSPVRMWESIMTNFMIRNRVVPKLFVNHKQGQSIRGGYVKDIKHGMQENIVTFDATSLYPSIMLATNLSMETFQGISDPKDTEDILSGNYEKPTEQFSLAGNGARFSTASGKSMTAVVVQKMFDERKAYKKKMQEAQRQLSAAKDEDERKELQAKVTEYDILQQAMKIALNSFFGAYSNSHFKFYNNDIAEAITVSGQVCVRWVEQAVNKFLNEKLDADKDYVVAIDTDSVMITLTDVLTRMKKDKIDLAEKEDLLDKIAEKMLRPVIEKAVSDLCQELNWDNTKISFKREVIANKAFWTAKKNYVMNVLNSEGIHYDVPKLKMMGVKAIRSTTPQICRDAFKTLFRLIMNKEEADVRVFMKKFRKEFLEEDISNISGSTSVNNLKKYEGEDKSVPIHVRGSLLYNNLLRVKGLQNKYERIKEGDKIKFIYLKTPNKYNSHVIAYLDVIPKEFEIDDLIDRNRQFDVVFEKFAGEILSKINWSASSKNSLDDLL